MKHLYKLYAEMNVEKRPINKEIEEAKLAQKFAIGVYEENRNLLPKDWKRIDYYSNDKNGFYGEAYKKDGKVIIAFRGTEKKDLNDWKTDIQLGLKKLPSQYDSALKFYYQVEKYCKEHGIDKSNILITGHSLAGSLGGFVGPKVEVKTVTFNAYGIKDIAERYMILRNENENYVTNYGDVNDLTFYLKMHNQIGRTYVLDNDKKNKFPQLFNYHKAETIPNLEDAEPYDIHKHHKFEKESMSPDRVLVVEEVMRRKDKDHNNAFSHYFLQQAKRGYTMWEKDIDKKVSGGEVYVHSYTRDDGTYVREYYRRKPSY